MSAASRVWRSLAAATAAVTAMVFVASALAEGRDRTQAAQIALGRRLFYDADLSADGTLSCATCHEQKRAFAVDVATRPGVHGEPGRRNAPGLANVGALPVLTWGDPRLTRLEDQALVPITGEHPVEMGLVDGNQVLAERLGKDACYVRLFQAAFPAAGGQIGLTSVTSALAAFERTLVSTGSAYDRGQLSPAARRGHALFTGRFGCAGCHKGPNFTDGDFHDIGLKRGVDRGLGEITGQALDDGRFRTPGLRNAALTAPYLHDGRVRSLAEAIRAHSRYAGEPPDQAELDDLIAFLGSLTDRRFVTDPKLSLPKPGCPLA